MKSFKFLAVFAIMLIISTATTAQSARSRAQHKRIEHGVRNGELTRHEARQLSRQQRHIRRDRRDAYSDGVVTKRERREIRREKRHASKNIYRKKHNRRDRRI